MATILTELLAARRIEKLDGDEDRFAKIEQAAKNLSATFQESPSLIVQAVITGLCDMPDSDDPIISLATEQLTEVWKSVRTAYPDIPKPLLQSIILDACERLVDRKNKMHLTAAIWLTAVDTVPLCHIDKKVLTVINEMLTKAFDVAYNSHLNFINKTISSSENKTDLIKKLQDIKFETPNLKKTITYESLMTQVAAASGPQYKNEHGQLVPLDDSNNVWTNNQAWAHEFAPRMTSILLNLYEHILNDVAGAQATIKGSFSKVFESFATESAATLSSLSKAYALKLKQTHIASDILWWLESLYSLSAAKSYREMPPTMAAILMPLDLLNITSIPAPISVGYVLMEAVNKVPKAHFGDTSTWKDIFKNIRHNKNIIPNSALRDLETPQQAGCLSIRDAIVCALTLPDNDYNAQNICNRARIDITEKKDLPSVAHILFKQEQAVRLVRSAQ